MGHFLVRGPAEQLIRGQQLRNVRVRHDDVPGLHHRNNDDLTTTESMPSSPVHAAKESRD